MINPLQLAAANNWPLIQLNGKRPVTKDWPNAPGLTPAAAQQALDAGHNIGIVCGERAGRLLVLDYDGDVPPDMPATLRVYTGGGGIHDYYRVPEGVDLKKANKVKFPFRGTKIDARWTGGQVCYPPSVHPETGAVYEFAPGTTEIAEVPADAIAAILAGQTKPAPKNGSAPSVDIDNAYIRAAVTKGVNNVMTAPEGQHNDILNKETFSLAGLPGIDLAELETTMIEAATPRAPLTEARNTVRSAIAGGSAKPREIPQRQAPTAAPAVLPAATTAPVPPPAPPFRALGYYDGHYYFLPRLGGQVVDLTPTQFTKNNLFRLAPYKYWEDHYDDKPAYAANDLMSKCHEMGLYDVKNIRGRGAWHDDGRVVIHRGDKLLVDGMPTELTSIRSRFIYQKEHTLDLPYDNPLSQAEAYETVYKLCSMFTWENDNFGQLLAGWLALAPICGVLTWRPHIWISGPSGSGKSWVQNNVIKILGNAAIAVQGCSTEAGIRQLLRSDALAVSFDEAENDGTRQALNIQRVLELARQASSSDGGIIAKGSADGTANAFNIRSMFAMSSIGVGVTRRADQSRVSVLSLREAPTGPVGVEQFRQIQDLTAQYCKGEHAQRFVARSLRLASVVRESAEQFSTALASSRTNRRNADQIGALLAGYWMYRSDEPATAEDARVLCNDYDVDAVLPDDDGNDERQLLDFLLRRVVRCELRDSQGVSRSVSRSVIELLDGARHDDHGEEKNLNRLGIRTMSDGVFFSAKNPELSKLLDATQWATDWSRWLKRLPGVRGKATARISGAVVKGVLLPDSLVFDGEGDGV